MIRNKILIFGGTGSLGYALNKRYAKDNKIVNMSRDESKHWKMKLDFESNPNISFIIGNVADKQIVKQTISRVNPNIIIIASAMKHIDQCETNTRESIRNNFIGTQNILDSIEELCSSIDTKTVVFVSTDKACSPVNNYGMCKALSENIVQEKAHYVPSIKFVSVRYGNVLNSRGSIIPMLHELGRGDSTHLTLTDERMTRFIMTIEQSVDLI
jgi:UDP-glucose 4-epimerase